MISLYYYFLADFDSTLFLYTSKYWCDTLVRKCHLYKMDIYFNGSFWFASFFFYVLKMCFQLWLWNLCHHNELFMRCMCPINIEAEEMEKKPARTKHGTCNFLCSLYLRIIIRYLLKYNRLSSIWYIFHFRNKCIHPTKRLY